MANNGSIASIFKRGGQKPEFTTAADDPDPADASKQLDQHLQQLSVAWAAPRQRYVLAAYIECIAVQKRKKQSACFGSR